MTRSRQIFSTAALLTAAAALGVGPAPLATAQQRVQNGNALDANQQVGSGGQNRVENQVDYAQRNLIVTGQVGGGRSFQGNIDYFTAGGFQDGLGSDSLFNFRRDSIYSSPQALGVQVRDTGGQVVVTRSTTQIPGYQAAAALGNATRTVYDANSGTLSFRQNDGGLVLIPGVRDLNQVGSLYSLGNVRTQDGGYAAVNASPLTGIQVNPLNTQPYQINPSTTPQRDPLDPDLFNTPGGQDGQDAQRDLRLYGQPPAQEDGDIDPNRAPGDHAAAMQFQNTAGRAQPAMVLGNQIQQQLAIAVTQGEGRANDGALTTLNNYIFGVQPGAGAEANPNQPPQAPTNPYDALLAQIREQAQLDDPQEGDGPDAAEREPWQDVLENPDEAVLDAISRARDDAVRRSLGLVDEHGNVDRDAELPEIDTDSELGQLIADLDYNLPRLATLSGEDRQVRQNKMLLRAEQDLAAGSYLSAENIYRQILRESGDNPLAKAGLIHAQLGGGMIRSAAFNLRALFSEHPELIALKYDESLLPSAERMRWLQRELQEMIAQDIHGAEPGLILAYLGYQLEAEPLMQYGLGIAQERSPRDPLLPVLDRIWLERGGSAE